MLHLALCKLAERQIQGTAVQQPVTAMASRRAALAALAVLVMLFACSLLPGPRSLRLAVWHGRATYGNNTTWRLLQRTPCNAPASQCDTPVAEGATRLTLVTVAMKLAHELRAPAHMDRLGLWSLNNKDSYCRASGCQFLPVFHSSVPHEHVHPSWQKVAYLLTMLTPDSCHDWVWVLDLDAFIMNKTLTFDNHVLPAVANRNVSIIVSKDCGGLNAGSLFVRNTDWTRKFLQQVWALRDKRHEEVPNILWWWEQAAMRYLIQRMDPQEVAANIAFVPQRLINAYVNECYVHYQPGDFVLHMAGPKQKELVANDPWTYLANA